MPHITTCTRCGRLYEESSEEYANTPAWTGDRLCPECHFERRSERIRGELDAGRLPDPADLSAQVDHIGRENVAIADDLAAALREYDGDADALEADLDDLEGRLS